MKKIDVQILKRPAFGTYLKGNEVKVHPLDFHMNKRKEDFRLNRNGEVVIDYDLGFGAVNRNRRVRSGDYSGSITFLQARIIQSAISRDMFLDSYLSIMNQVRDSINKAKSDVCVALSNTVKGRQGNIKIPWLRAYGFWREDINMVFGIHLLNPEKNNLYHKTIKLPANCTLVGAKLVRYSPRGINPYFTYFNTEQRGDVLSISAHTKEGVVAIDAARAIPCYLEFKFEVNESMINEDWGTPYAICEIPEIWGAYHRKKI